MLVDDKKSKEEQLIRHLEQGENLRDTQFQQSDYDKEKIGMIYEEFALNFCIDIVSFLHFFLLLFIRGFNVTLLTHLAVIRSLYNSYWRLYNNFRKFFSFREFMKNLEKDFPQILYKLGDEALNRPPDSQAEG
mmetsp:Transcript_5550/g.9496  ORF Transcript_5550/g.9496 Transcript_5550/m.9496 type:complete len:133 (+) Transcript_5550:2090-2488(+)